MAMASDAGVQLPPILLNRHTKPQLPAMNGRSANGEISESASSTLADLAGAHTVKVDMGMIGAASGVRMVDEEDEVSAAVMEVAGTGIGLSRVGVGILVVDIKPTCRHPNLLLRRMGTTLPPLP